MKLQVISAQEIVRSTAEGEIDFPMVKEIIGKIVSIEKISRDCVILLDARSTKANLSPTDLWHIALELDKHRSVFNSKNALVVPSEDFDTARFLELCANNRGIGFRVFSKYEEAMDWLATVYDLEH